MSDTEANGNVDVSVTLAKPKSHFDSFEDGSLKTEAEQQQPQQEQQKPPPASESTEITANSDLQQVKEILRASRDEDPLEDKSSFYPLQQKTQYMSPMCTLSSESKRIIRQAQAPILQSSPRVVHFLYEVGRTLFYPEHFGCLLVLFVCLRQSIHCLTGRLILHFANRLFIMLTVQLVCINSAFFR